MLISPLLAKFALAVKAGKFMIAKAMYKQYPASKRRFELMIAILDEVEVETLQRVIAEDKLLLVH